MPEDKTIVPPGSKVTIEIDEETGAGDIAGTSAAGEDTGGAFGILEGARTEDPLNRRIVPAAIVFLDLGTRLRSVPEIPGDPDYYRARALSDTSAPAEIDGGFNEYVEINLDGLAEDFAGIDTNNPANSGTRGFNAAIPAALVGAFDKALLGSRAPEALDALDPLGKTPANGSGRSLPNVMPLPFYMFARQRSGSMLLDFILSRIGDAPEIKTFPISEVDRESVRNIGNPPGYPFPKLDASRWTKRKPSEKDSLEKWNSVNLAGGEALESGQFQTNGLGGVFHVKIDSRLYWETFDTQDKTNFKVTREARFDADEVDFSFNPARGARIFLKPQFLVMCPHRTWQSCASQFTWETYYHDYTNASVQPYRSRVGVGLIQAASSSDFGTPILSGGYGIFLHVSGTYNPATLPGTYELEAHIEGTEVVINCSGAASGTIRGASAPALYGRFLGVVSGEIVPGLNVSAECLFYPGETPTGAASAATLWQGESASSVLGAALTTATAGRLPMYGRLFNSDWATLYYLNGHAPGFAYATGLQLGFSSDFGRYAGGVASFKRRPLWLGQEVIKELTQQAKITPLSYFAHDSAGGIDCVVNESPIRPPALQAIAFGGAALPLLPDNHRILDLLRACIGGKAWHRNLGVPVYSASGVYSGDYRQSLDIIPPRSAPAGRLCGIIESGGGVYYIWGKTVSVREGADYVRDQATGLL